MRVSEIGEFGLITLLARELGIDYPPTPAMRPRPGLVVDLGDDALVSERRDAAIVWTTDTMVAGVHFRPEWSSWPDVGWKALAVNVSDVAAMGATPELALVTLALPPDSEVDDVVDLYRGLRECAEAFGLLIAGGDIVRSPVLSVTIALSGRAETAPEGSPVVMTRSAARVGDVVAVTGSLGDSGGGLELLRTGDEERSASKERLRRRHVRPDPRVEAGRAAVRAGVRCATDVSDGLVQDLGHVARASGVGIRVEAARVPLSMELQEVFPARALGFGLAGGEDYELALVAPRSVIEPLLDRAEPGLTEIGEVVGYDTPRVAVVDEQGREVDPGVGGWDHFRGGGQG